MPDFTELFEAITDVPPFPWQTALYQRFAHKDIPSTASIPTGLGKTSIIAIWLLALARHPDRLPPRLIYVVNRRTVVDQTTTEVERIRNALGKPKLAEVRGSLASLCALPLPTPDAPPLAISTLRGSFADNGEWCVDPSRPAVVVGTVDMIGSGLLFSRYTRGFKTRPLHAGFLGQDVLLVHDEAHLEPPFQLLIESIATAQRDARDKRKLRVMELTATTRSRDAMSNAKPFGLDENPDDKDTDHETVRERIYAFKRLTMLPVSKLEDGKDKANDTTVTERIVECARAKRASQRAILVFVRTVEMAVKISEALPKDKCATLTGTMRGKERDELVSNSRIFQRFLPENDRAELVLPSTGTVFLVATSAGEVGVNITADDLICDLSTYESMAQRFGRVNRFGKCDDSEICIVYRENLQATYAEGLEKAKSAKKDAEKKAAAYDRKNQSVLRLIKTLALLQKLGDSASPAALNALDPSECAAAFSPPPVMRVATDIQFDAWSLTSIRAPIAARPPVEPYLHGEAEWQPPETHVAWRKELDVLSTPELRNAYAPADLLEDFPLKPHELLRDNSERIHGQLVRIIKKLEASGRPIPLAWLIRENGEPEIFQLSQLLMDKEADDDGDDEEEEEDEVEEIARDAKKAETVAKTRALASIANATLVLPASLGGIENGLFTAGAAGADADVADLPNQRIRVRSDSPNVPADFSSLQYRLVRVIDTCLLSEQDEDSDGNSERYWLWLEAKTGNQRTGRAMSSAPESLAQHSAAVTANAEALALKLFPDATALSAGEPDLRRSLVLAAQWHDLGKNRLQWQRNLGNFGYDPANPETILAKSASGMKPRSAVESYRHEFGSLNDASICPGFDSLSDIEREVILHIISAHHGRGRPHFPTHEIGDIAPGADAVLAAVIPRRFARLQQRYGRWGLAWLESLLRAADYAASAGIIAATKNERLMNSKSTAYTCAGESNIAPSKQTLTATATLTVDPANPGQYFACCGLFELASRLSPEALAWYEINSTNREWQFHLANTPSLSTMLKAVTDADMVRLDSSDNHTAVKLSLPRELTLNWWRYEKRSSGKLKTWAGQQGASSILEVLRDILKAELSKIDAYKLFEVEAAPSSAVSYFDAPRSANSAARDVGFSMDRLKKGGVVYENVIHPAIEFFGLLGLQRARPALVPKKPKEEQIFAYHTWRSPISITLLPAAVVGLLPDCDVIHYHFANPSRTKDYLAFTPSKIISAS